MEHTVLLVDDDPQTIEGLKRVLQREPYRILSATSGSEGLDLLSSHEVDVVLADERMPGMSGVDFLAQVRRYYPDTVRIVLTGYATLEAAVRAINEGQVYYFFLKPVDPRELSVAIRHALREKDLREANRRLFHLVRKQCELVRRGLLEMAGAIDSPSFPSADNLHHLTRHIEEQVAVLERFFRRSP